MRSSEMMVIRGAIFGSLIVGVLGFLLTAGVRLPASGKPLQLLPTEYTSPTHERLGETEQIECSLSKKYPRRILQWCGLITRHAQKYDLPADLVAALVWQESGGNPAAYSHSGAVGLMQVMPRDGLAANFQCGSGSCFANRPATRELKNPSFNIKYGTRMLATLVKKHASLREALKAYGPMDVGYYYADKVLGIYKRYGTHIP